MQEETIKRKIEVKGFVSDFNNRFCRLLDTITQRKQNPKDLVLTKEVRSCLELVIDQKKLRERSVSLVPLNEESIAKYADGSDSQLVFIVPPEIETLKMVKRFIENVKKRRIKKTYNLVIYPKRTVLLQYMIRDMKLHFEFMNRIYDFNLDLIPLNVDLLSLENSDILKEIYVKKEFNGVNIVSQSLIKLQMIFGKAKAWFGKGELAHEAIKISKRIEHCEKKLTEKYDSSDRSQIDGIIVMDRSIDHLTPLCTQFSYQGQLDDYFDIDYNKILVDQSIVEDDPAKIDPKKKKSLRMYLTPDDVIFQQIKDFTLDEARYFVGDKMKSFQKLTDQLKGEPDRELLALAAKEKKFVKKYKEHLTLAMHVQKNLQKPVNFKLFEYEQVTFDRFC